MLFGYTKGAMGHRCHMQRLNREVREKLDTDEVNYQLGRIGIPQPSREEGPVRSGASRG